ncbi:sas10/Utp3/C1D family domain-containing protein [Trichoderma breve]|uniref:Sas10/Utp3/C1D family domain-containing protein n=1 Tax=Trichoderma breve TaxID=2034170 RepID=A0A9W9E1Q2_9HYPO|nr:sas10/Utp3/C1D family domain-containing protein [Trichoderma breve]KAJ4854838.1 sas10/Utp3/C1D family domain-containing protein [Trichoderma breve]
MAAATTLPALLASLTQSLSLAQEGTSKISTIDHPKDGISLLDVKNELLLSYLQNLVFLILVKLRNAKSDGKAASKEKDQDLDDAVRTKLVELRLFLEKGARPLEEKLRFSIDRFLRTAEDAQRREKMKEAKENAKTGSSTDESGSGSEDDDEDEDEEDDSEAEDGHSRPQPKRGNFSAAPNMGSLMDDVAIRPAKRDQNDDAPAGVYRPPRRERQVMETTQTREKAARRPMRSHTMEEFVASELSSAPIAEPSIGTTIVQGGRRMKTQQERKDEQERTEYEETNFTRLPKESKKERAKKAKQAGRSGRMQFGGEEWHNLGEGVDRIDRLTKRKEGGAGSGVRAMLEKSRKRGGDTEDGPRGSGHQMGERFHKKARLMEIGRGSRGKGRK